MYYYQTDNPEAIAIFEKLRVDGEILMMRGRRLARLFADEVGVEVTPVYVKDWTRMEFAGIEFDGEYLGTVLDTRLWSKPAKHRPRMPLKRIPSDLKLLAGQVENLWAKRPRDRVDFTPMYTAIGVQWTDYIFGGTFKWALLDGKAFIASTIQATPGVDHLVEEITASSFTHTYDKYQATKTIAQDAEEALDA